jgi:hypothetical protein
LILLSYKRPHNIPVIVESALRAPSVGHIVVSNNNPDIDLRKYYDYKAHGSRITLLCHERRVRQGIRFELPARFPHEYYLSVDDDVLLLPEQIETVLGLLREDPRRIHGVFGESPANWPAVVHQILKILGEDPLVGYPFKTGYSAGGESCEVSHLTNAYAFSARHVARYVELCTALGITDLETFGNGEDLVLSHSGSLPPKVHDVGPVYQCLSAFSGIATWISEPDFFETRVSLCKRLNELSPDWDDFCGTAVVDQSSERATHRAWISRRRN